MFYYRSTVYASECPEDLTCVNNSGYLCDRACPFRQHQASTVTRYNPARNLCPYATRIATVLGIYVINRGRPRYYTQGNTMYLSLKRLRAQHTDG